jgi:type IV fimbrial biogenesis protein FimT
MSDPASRPARFARGFTLIELLVTVGITALLVLAAIPFASNWVYSSQTLTGRTELIEAFSLAKALALQNPAQIALPSAAAGMRVVTDGTTTTLLVCTGSSAASGCAIGGANVQWSATYSGLVTTTINGVAAAPGSPLSLDLDDRGEPLSGTAFVLSRGAASNNETGSLY